MLSALTRAGQFAHVHELGLEASLDGFYSPIRREVSRDKGSDVLPDGLWEAWNSGFLSEKVFSPISTMRALTQQYGELCPVCLNTTSQRHYWFYYGDSWDETALMPDYLLVPIPRSSVGRRWNGPICNGCYYTMGRFLKDNYSHQWTEDETNFAIAKMMLSSAAFKKRVKSGPKLRFDPRQPKIG